jgi:hypothetical protein
MFERLLPIDEDNRDVVPVPLEELNVVFDISLEQFEWDLALKCEQHAFRFGAEGAIGFGVDLDSHCGARFS